VPHAASYRRVLYPSLFKDPAITALVGMAEHTFSAIGDNLYVVMGMEGPYGPGRKCVIIEDTQAPKLHMQGIVIIAERKVPSPLERTVHYVSPDLINIFRLAYNYR